jgi:exonuclease SbcD
MAEILSGIVADLADRIDRDIPAILAAHVTVTGASLGSERSMVLGNEPSVLVSNLANPAFDYVALGHIHKHQVVHANPPVVYAGSLERIDFGEEADEKGFCEVDIKEKDELHREVIFQFHKIEGRRFITINIMLDAGDADPNGTILEEIQKYPVKDSIVRLNIISSEGERFILKDPEIFNVLKESYYYSITTQVTGEERSRLGKLSVSALSPVEALEAYLKLKNFSPAKTKLLLEHGERLIRGQMDAEQSI